MLPYAMALLHQCTRRREHVLPRYMAEQSTAITNRSQQIQYLMVCSRKFGLLINVLAFSFRAHENAILILIVKRGRRAYIDGRTLAHSKCFSETSAARSFEAWMAA